MLPKAREGEKKPLIKHKIRVKSKPKERKPPKLEVLVNTYILPTLRDYIRFCRPMIDRDYIGRGIIVFFDCKKLTAWCLVVRGIDRARYFDIQRVRVLGLCYMEKLIENHNKKQNKLNNPAPKRTRVDVPLIIKIKAIDWLKTNPERPTGEVRYVVPSLSDYKIGDRSFQNWRKLGKDMILKYEEAVKRNLLAISVKSGKGFFGTMEEHLKKELDLRVKLNLDVSKKKWIVPRALQLSKKEEYKHECKNFKASDNWFDGFVLRFDLKEKKKNSDRKLTQDEFKTKRDEWLSIQRQKILKNYKPNLVVRQEKVYLDPDFVENLDEVGVAFESEDDIQYVPSECKRTAVRQLPVGSLDLKGHFCTVLLTVNGSGYKYKVQTAPKPKVIVILKLPESQFLTIEEQGYYWTIGTTRDVRVYTSPKGFMNSKLWQKIAVDFAKDRKALVGETSKKVLVYYDNVPSHYLTK